MPRENDETTLLTDAIQSPTSIYAQNRRFVFVRDPDLQKRIRAAAVEQAQVTNASLLIVRNSRQDDRARRQGHALRLPPNDRLRPPERTRRFSLGQLCGKRRCKQRGIGELSCPKAIDEIMSFHNGIRPPFHGVCRAQSATVAIRRHLVPRPHTPLSCPPVDPVDKGRGCVCPLPANASRPRRCRARRGNS